MLGAEVAVAVADPAGRRAGVELASARGQERAREAGQLDDLALELAVRRELQKRARVLG